MLKYIIILFSFSNLAFAGETKSPLSEFRASDNSFRIIAPHDLQFNSSIYVKDTPMFWLFDATEYKWFNFIMASKSYFNVDDDINKSIKHLYATLFSDITYKILVTQKISQRGAQIGLGFILENTDVTERRLPHYNHLDIIEGSNAYYIVQVRHSNKIRPSWMSLGLCKNNKCEVSKDQLVLNIPSDVQ